MAKKFKFIFPLLAFILMLGASTGYASSEENKNSKKYDMEIVDVKTEKYTTKDGEIVTKKDYYNKQGEVIKSETEKAITPTASGDSITTLAAPHWVANTIVGKEWQFGWPQLRVYGTGSSKSYTSSSKTTYRAIDRIGVNTTLYYNNAVEDTATQTKSNAAVASATAWQQSTNCCWQYKGQTTHTFQEAGYQSWYPVTTDYSS